MTKLPRRSLLAAGLTVPALRAASAQATWPTRPVALVNPWPAGGSSDTMTRIFAQRLGQVFGQPFVVENRAGASGTIGHNYVAQARPDGYVLLSGTNSTYAIAPHLMSALPYDTRGAFTGISLLARTAQAVCVHPSIPVNTIQEFLAYVKARPGEITFSSAGIGASSHLATELLISSAGLDMMHVPYRGGAPSAQALLAGETKMSFIDAITALPYRQSGMLKMLAVSTAERTPLAPDVPTLQEAGVTGFESSTDMALLGPANLPEPIVARLTEAVQTAVNDPVFRQQVIAQGALPVGSTPTEFAAYWTQESEKWANVIRARNIRMPS